MSKKILAGGEMNNENERMKKEVFRMLASIYGKTDEEVYKLIDEDKIGEIYF